MAVIKAPKLKISIHQSAVLDQEITNFLKGVAADYTFISNLPFTEENLITVNTKYGFQVDEIKAKVRMNHVIPPMVQDIIIIGSDEILRAKQLSLKYPDTKIFVVALKGDDPADIEKSDNMRGTNWQYIHEFILDKLGIKKKEKEKKGESKPKGKNYPKPNFDPKRSRPTEVTDKDDDWVNGSDTPLGEQYGDGFDDGQNEDQEQPF